MDRPTILLADDSEDNRAIFRHILEHGGYRVQVAANGMDAVRLTSVCRPRLVIMDLAMPVMSGFEALAALRQLPQVAHTPVVAFSAHDYSLQNLLELGFCMFIRKPVAPRAFLEYVRHCLGAGANGGAPDGLSVP
jgi:CheY-like chemotaxis protein